jgi:hypothetical protein
MHTNRHSPQSEGGAFVGLDWDLGRNPAKQALSSTFRPSFLSRSYQRPEDGFGGDEAESLVERQDSAAEWAGG